MRTIFVSFPTYKQAKDVVNILLIRGIKEEEINVLVAEKVAKGSSNINWETINIEATGTLAEKKVYGLDALVGRQNRVINLPDTGEVYAAGELATLLARNAIAGIKHSAGSLKGILIESGIPVKVAEIYVNALNHEGVVLIVKLNDELASIPVGVFREYKGTVISAL
jgi:hypothetical protein